MDVEETYTIENDGYMDLVIEKIGESRLSVAHYYTQYDDLMSDPEIVFEVEDDELVPVRYTQHPHVHQYDETGLGRSVQDFCMQWRQNLEKQGFVEAARGGAAR